MLRRRYQRRQLGQLSGRPSFLNVPLSTQTKDEESTSSDKTRSNSDDWLYTVSRKQQTIVPEHKTRPRSLDWTFPNVKVPSAIELKTMNNSRFTVAPVPSQEINNYVIANKTISK